METQAFNWIQILTALACFLQNIEYLWLHFTKLLPAKNLYVLALDLFSLVLSLGLFLMPESAFLLLIIYFIRYVFLRGPFNGGSDSMTHILLLTLSMGAIFSTHSILFRAALSYLGLQTILSYFIAGMVKLRSPNWWNGFSLKFIIGSSHYAIPVWARKIFLQGPWSLLFSWMIVLFEVTFPSVLFSFRVSIVVLSMALIFHVANAFVLGLNRFFWAWIAAFPAVFYISSFTSHL